MLRQPKRLIHKSLTRGEEGIDLPGSFGIPPSALGADFLDAYFCLKPKSTNVEAFVQKVYEGVQLTLLHPQGKHRRQI